MNRNYYFDLYQNYIWFELYNVVIQQNNMQYVDDKKIRKNIPDFLNLYKLFISVICPHCPV